jgi:hypothetical protein
MIGHRTLDDIEACQQSVGRSGSADADGPALFSTRRDLAFVHLHRPVKAAYLKAIVRAALGHDPEKRIPILVNIGHFSNVFSYRQPQ